MAGPERALDYLFLTRSRVEESMATKQRLLDNLEDVVKAAQMLVCAYRCGSKSLLFGNGGSAADAQHIAAELVGRFQIDRPALPAIALNVNTSSLTAIGNDYGFEDIFARQIEAFGREGDVAVGLSTSGNSKNVIEGIRRSRELGLKTVALTGAGGGCLRDLVDCCIAVPSSETPRIQESHILIGHVLCEIVERELFGGNEA
jgi:D-sedoheptulose 7-phosphate isomerase